MKCIKRISGILKSLLKLRGWIQGPEKLWSHKLHHYTTDSRLRRVEGRGGFYHYERIDGLTLRAAAKREGLLPR